MILKDIVITDFDKKRLLALVASKATRSTDTNIKELENEIKRAKVVSSKEITGDIVTMNSKVTFEFIDSHDEMTFQLVFPENANFNLGRISILAPIGMALLGYHIGDIIEWETPSGKTKVMIKNILYQPEASGDYHL